jgi:hypothetical protein
VINDQTTKQLHYESLLALMLLIKKSNLLEAILLILWIMNVLYKRLLNEIDDGVIGKVFLDIQPSVEKWFQVSEGFNRNHNWLHWQQKSHKKKIFKIKFYLLYQSDNVKRLFYHHSPAVTNSIKHS